VVGTVNTVSSGSVDIGIGGATIDVTCPIGQRIIGGGYQSSSSAVTVFTARILSVGPPGTYRVQADDGALIGPSVTAFAYCV
jgi:hypothetical protein